MKVIVQHDEKMSSYLAQYAMHIEDIGLSYKVIDIEEKYLPWLREITQYTESSFSIELYKDEYIGESVLDSNEMILASIGAKVANKRVGAHYNMVTHTQEQADKGRNTTAPQWINCYSDNNKISAADYIKCICYLMSLATEWHKPIIIYANIYVPDETYRYRALTYKIVNSYLVNRNGILITKIIKKEIYNYYTPAVASYERYADHTIYLDECLNDAVIKVIPLLYSKQSKTRFKNVCKSIRQNNMLYDNNVFYEAISPDQEIYVTLNVGGSRNPEEYKALGLEYIPLIGSYGMLYAKRSLFDGMREMLSLEVAYPYYEPILSYQFCDKDVINENFSYELIPDNIEYRGNGVYIGVITTDNVDYTSRVLRTKEGKSRIACIWEQVRADEGTYALKEQIDQALDSPEPGQIINLPDGDSISTMILGIAGGGSDVPHYRGVATEAEFLVAKINTAPEALQKIYGGMPSENAVTMADTLVGVLKLIDFAKREGKPLVLCVPFNTNIDPHDGSLMFCEILGLLAARERITIIVPAGEEADKMHHYSIGGKQPASTTINIRVQKENQNVVVIAYQKFANIITALLFPPENIEGGPIDLMKIDVTYLNGAMIYSNGYKTSPLNGAIRMLFRIESPQAGTWRIEFKLDTELTSQIDIWISQQELNEYITLSPNSSFITIGSLASINNVITVGGYDEGSMVVLRSSGRGYSWDNRVKPLFVTHANNITSPCEQGKWVQVTGTLPAASIMLGVAATVYNKCIAERFFPLPNTLVMSSLMLGMMKQFEEVEYPNPSHGYGVVDIRKLDSLLTGPLVLSALKN